MYWNFIHHQKQMENVLHGQSLPCSDCKSNETQVLDTPVNDLNVYQRTRSKTKRIKSAVRANAIHKTAPVNLVYELDELAEYDNFRKEVPEIKFDEFKQVKAKIAKRRHLIYADSLNSYYGETGLTNLRLMPIF